MINLILETSNNEGLCHEGFNKDEPSEYTRFGLHGLIHCLQNWHIKHIL